MKSQPEYVQKRVKEGIAEKLSLQNPKLQRLVVEAVTDDEGETTFNKDDCQTYLGKSWNKKFQAADIHEGKGKSIVPAYGSNFPRVQRQPNFIELASSLLSSSLYPKKVVSTSRWYRISSSELQHVFAGRAIFIYDCLVA